MTYDGTALRLWINGKETATTAASGLVLERRAVPPTIGAHNPGIAGQGYFFHGQIDEVRISDQARQPDEFNVSGGQPTVPYEADAHTVALMHFNDSAHLAEDSSTNDLAGGTVGNPRWTAAGLFDGSLVL